VTNDPHCAEIVTVGVYVILPTPVLCVFVFPAIVCIVHAGILTLTTPGLVADTLILYLFFESDVTLLQIPFVTIVLPQVSVLSAIGTLRCRINPISFFITFSDHVSCF
jgi:hypothetical protein